MKHAENVLLLVLDTVRARSAYPGTPELTPNLSRIAKSGMGFEKAITTYPWSLSSRVYLHGEVRERTRGDSLQTLPFKRRSRSPRTLR